MELLDPGDDREQYGRMLEQTQRLYRRAGRVVSRRRSARARDVGDTIDRFDDLHRALLVRVFATVCGADGAWAPEEEALGAQLIDHVWSRRLDGEALREAIRHVESRVDRLGWAELVGPFGQMDELADGVAELETLVIRQANLLARVDGSLDPEEQAAISQIVESLRAGLRGKQPATDDRAATLPADPDEPKPNAEEEPAAPTRPLEEVMAELDGLIGLGPVKQEIRSLANYLALQSRRRDEGLPSTDISLHLVFAGNPGTGKTTVARLFAEAMRALGVLDGGQLVETDRSGLVAGYAGQTGPRTHEKVDEALGGVLFIDEAYSLVAKEGDDPFGREAVQALLKRAEDDRERLSIVLAGYPEPIERLLDANPGLSSRFSRVIRFDDYGPRELGHIFGLLLARNHYRLTQAARLRVHQAIAAMHAARDESFGNGRAVRNLFEQAILRMANRLASMPDATREELVTFEADDIPHEGPAPDEARIVVKCPGCDDTSTAGSKLLGAAVRCRKCDERFTVEWCELAPDAAAQ